MMSSLSFGSSSDPRFTPVFWILLIVSMHVWVTGSMGPVPLWPLNCLRREKASMQSTLGRSRTFCSAISRISSADGDFADTRSTTMKFGAITACSSTETNTVVSLRKMTSLITLSEKSSIFLLPFSIPRSSP